MESGNSQASTETSSNKQIAVGGAWIMAARLLDRGIGLVSIGLLARLLQPADFGLVAMAGTVVAMLELINAFGFDWALVRHKSPTRDHYDTAWTLRISLGIVTMLALMAVSPIAAKFYGRPELALLLSVMGSGAIISALENIGTVDFRRSMKFGSEFYMRASTKIVGFLVTVGLAWWLRTYWALVLGNLAARAACTLLSYRMHNFRPRFTIKESRDLMSFSTWLLVGNLVEFLRSRFADFYVARAIGARDMGLFVLSSEMANMGVSEVAAPINRAAYSKYSIDLRTSGDIRPTYIKVASAIWFLSLPMAMGIYLVAPEAVRLFFGPSWADAAPVLKITAIGAAFTTMTANTHYVYWSMNRPNVVVILSFIGLLIVAPLTLILGSTSGVSGVASAYAIGSGILVPVNLLLLWKLFGISPLDLLRNVWRIVLATALMVLIVHYFTRSIPAPTVMDTAYLFGLKCIIGVAGYSLMLYGFWLFSGRPAGVEQDMLVMARKIYRSVTGYVLKHPR